GVAVAEFRVHVRMLEGHRGDAAPAGAVLQIAVRIVEPAQAQAAEGRVHPQRPEGAADHEALLAVGFGPRIRLAVIDPAVYVSVIARGAVMERGARIRR